MANKKSETTATLGFESTLWQAADKLRSNMDAAEYKHVVLGLMFLKYISDAFVALQQELQSLVGAATLYRETWFFPAAMIVVGSHNSPSSPCTG